MKLIMWTNGDKLIRGAVVERRKSRNKYAVDIILEDGRWFNNAPERALMLNINWILTDEDVDNNEVNTWLELSKVREQYVFSAVVTLQSNSEKAGVNTYRRAPVIKAKNIEEAEFSIRRHYGEDSVIEISDLKLSDCQIGPFWCDTIEAS